MAQMDLAQELLCPEFGLSSSYHLALARLHLLRAEYDNAEYNLKEALKDSFQTGDYGKAQDCYEKTLVFVMDATLSFCSSAPSICRRKCENNILVGLRELPSCLICLGLGIAGYRLGELTEAEDALTEANTLNNGNPDLWGYLSADVVSGDPGSSALPPAGLCPAPTFTKETQLNVDYQLAAQYYQEADECFHYAVSIDQTHLPSRPWPHGSSTRPRPLRWMSGLVAEKTWTVVHRRLQW
ncbi:hypothetical protein DPEC_G00177920 [Dallia pectoralis]|uniref:Uncharacterized protein n=1 Tax=Dallia pectoralis TaxID=75939 RepID=A0ACC2GFE3_DALPE|nr:hypothetical protein DPEC_G00177920 [Dallia pectoralis]